MISQYDSHFINNQINEMRFMRSQVAMSGRFLPKGHFMTTMWEIRIEQMALFLGIKTNRA